MLIELRIYTYHPGRLQPLLPEIEREVLPIQLRHLGRLIGYFVSDSGRLNQTTQVWGFKDAADREARRAALAADPEWQAIAARLIDALQSQESRLLKPTNFSPIR